MHSCQLNEFLTTTCTSKLSHIVHSHTKNTPITSTHTCSTQGVCVCLHCVHITKLLPTVSIMQSCVTYTLKIYHWHQRGHFQHRDIKGGKFSQYSPTSKDTYNMVTVNSILPNPNVWGSTYPQRQSCSLQKLRNPITVTARLWRHEHRIYTMYADGCTSKWLQFGRETGIYHCRRKIGVGQ